MTMNELEAARPLTDWLYTKSGLRYRWVALDKKEIISQDTQPDRCANTEPSACKRDRSIPLV